MDTFQSIMALIAFGSFLLATLTYIDKRFSFE
ncbi:putative holin-like toxin [Paenibacillus sp. D51F]